MRHALLIGLLAVTGCAPRVRDCKQGTLLVSLSLDAASAQADRLHVIVVLAGAPLTDDVAFQPGTSTGTLEIDLPSYPAGQTVDVTVIAERGDVVLGQAEASLPLDATCGALTLSITASADAGAPDLADGGEDAGGPQPDLFTPQPIASACSLDAQCLSGHCVDGYCCQTACTGVCEACDVPGELGGCAQVTSGQPHGTRAHCAGEGTTCGGACDVQSRTACTYPGSSTSCRAQSCTANVETLAAGCDGTGGCPLPPTTIACSSSCSGAACLGACSTDADCTVSPNLYCQPDGTCKSTKPNGRVCSASAECTSASCIDGYCCNSACAGQCQACDVAGNLGTCTTVTSGNAHGTRTKCSGYGTTCGASCTGASPTSCTFSTAQCRAQSCSGGVLTRAASCAGGSCPTAQTTSCGLYRCNAAGSDCLTSCSTSTDCNGGSGVSCYAGACCQSQCSTYGGSWHCGFSCGASCGGCATGRSCIDGTCECSTCERL
ncbi:MAG TPA: hypothetical protein VII38_00160 [Polyangia bacterium]|jgi:hypothetical protein